MKNNVTSKLKGRIGPKLKKLWVSVLAVVMALTAFGGLGGVTAMADVDSSITAVAKVMPSSAGIPNGTKISLGNSSFDSVNSFCSNGAEFRPYVGTENSVCVCLPREDGTFNDVATLYYSDVATVNGRALCAKLEITQVKASNTQSQGRHIDNEDYNVVFVISVSGLHADNNINEISWSLQLYYQDTYEKYNFPCWVEATDLDTYNYDTSESFTGSTDVYDEFYVWDQCILEAEQNGKNVTFRNKYKDGNHETDTNEEMYFQSGLVAATDTGYAEGTMTIAQSAGNFIYMYASIPENPAKTVSTNADYYVPGDTVSYSVTQKMGKFYDEVFTLYKNMSMTDTLPEGLTYVNGSGRMYSDNIEITNTAGSFSYNNKGILTYTFTDSWLQDTDNYAGQTLKMTFDATVDAGAAETLTNNAYTTISDIQFDAEPVDITVEAPKMQIIKSVDPSVVSTGDEVTYTLTVNQINGNIDECTNVVISDELPAELTLAETPTITGVSGAKVSVNGNGFTITIPTMKTTETAVVTVKAIANNPTSSIRNTAYVTVDNGEGDDDDADVTILKPGLILSKDADGKIYEIGDTVTYTITVKETEEGATSHNVRVSDTLPEGLTITGTPSISYDGSGGDASVSVSGNTVTATIPRLSYGETATITVQAVVGESLAGRTIDNEAAAKDDDGDESHDTATIDVPKAALAITKDADYGPYNIGDAVEYTIRVNQTEEGATAKNIVVSDTLPGSLKLESVTADNPKGTVSIDGNSFTVKYDSLNDSTTAIITVKATAERTGNEIINTAYADADYVSEVSDYADIGVIAPKLSILKVADNGPYSVGDTIEYTINVEQTAEGATAKNVVVSDTLPSSLKLLSVTANSPKGAVTTDGNSFTVKYDSLNYGTTAEITVKAEALRAGSGIINTAAASADHTDEVTDTAVVEVIKPKLSISKSAESGPYQVGDEFDYTITVTQTEDDATAKNVVVTDTLPDEVQLVNVSTSKGNAETSGNSFTVSCGDMAKGDTATVTVTAKVLAEGSNIPNIAYADADNADEVSDGADILAAEPVLKISKEADETQYYVGDTVTYTITVKQANADIDAKNVVVTDTLPEGLELISAKATSVYDGSVDCDITTDGNSFTANINKLSSKDYVTITVKAEATEAAANQSLKNTAVADAENVSEPVEDDETVDVLKPVLSITKDADGTDYGMDDTVTYTINVEQTEPGLTAQNVVISDSLPNELQLIDVTANGGSVSKNGNGFTVTYKSLAYGETATITVTATCLTDKEGVVNTATATADHADDVEDDSTITIRRPQLSITKTASPTVYSQLDTVTYEIDVNETVGGLTAKNVVVSDTLPAELTLTGVTADAPQGSVSTSGNSFTVTYGELSYGTTARIFVTAIANTESENIVNTAYAQATYTDEVSDSADITVRRPDIDITKDVDGTTYYPGDTATYTLTVTNKKAEADVDVEDAESAEEEQAEDVEPEADNPAESVQAMAYWADDHTLCVSVGEEFEISGKDISQILQDEALADIEGASSIDEEGNEWTNAKFCATAAGTYTVTLIYMDGMEEAVTVIASDAEATPDDIDPDDEEPDDTEPGIEEPDTEKPSETTDSDGRIPTAYNVVVSDTLPDGLTLISADTEMGTISTDGNSFTVNVDSMYYMDSFTITVTAYVEESAANSGLHNVGYATADNADDVDDYADIEVIKPELSVTKEADKDIYSIGEEVDYTISVTQDVEGLSAYNAVVSDTLPGELELVDAQLTGVEGTVSIDGNGFTVSIPELAYGETATVHVTATAAAAGSGIVNVAYADADHADPKQDDETIEVLWPDLDIEKTVDKYDHYVNDEVIYNITVHETVEGAEAHDVVVSDTMPEGIELVDVETVGKVGEVTIDGDSFTVEYDTLGYEDEANITVTAKADEAAANKVSDNVATVYASNIPEPKQDDAEIVIEEPALSIVKEADSETHYVGEDVTYTITVTQTVEDAVEENVVIIDEIPDGLTIRNARLEGADGRVSQVGQDLTIEIPTLAYGEAAVVTVRAEVGEELSGKSVTNTAYAEGSHTTQISDDADIDVVQPELAITKEADADRYNVGDTVTYTITVEQTVKDLVETDVVVKDTLPDEVSVLGIPELTGVRGTVTISGNGFVAEIPELAYGETAVITVQATVEESLAGGSATNVAYAQGSHTDEVNDSAKIKVTKSETPTDTTGTTSTTGTTGTTSGTTGVRTGDSRAPLAIAIIGCAAALGVIIVVMRRRKTA